MMGVDIVPWKFMWEVKLGFCILGCLVIDKIIDYLILLIYKIVLKQFVSLTASCGYFGYLPLLIQKLRPRYRVMLIVLYGSRL